MEMLSESDLWLNLVSICRTFAFRFGREPSAAQSGMVLFGTNAFSLLYYMECHYLPYTDTIIEYQKSTFHYYVLS